MEQKSCLGFRLCMATSSAESLVRERAYRRKSFFYIHGRIKAWEIHTPTAFLFTYIPILEVILMENIIWNKTIEPGAKWSGVIGKGKLLRFTALDAGANLSLLFYNAKDVSERYNMPDTLKAQYTSHLTTGNVLMSDNGRVLASIVEDSLGWHDPICGYTTRALTDQRYGKTNYQELRNDWLRSGQENIR